MKHLLILISLGINVTSLHAQELTDVDRDLLLDKLKEIQQTADSAARGKFSAAVSAFQIAAASDTAAHDLYLKCVEKVSFQDEARKAKDFREWRKRHKDGRDSAGFRRALRYQLSWLLKTIEICENPEARKRMPDAAIGMIESILADAKLLEDQKGVLGSSVLSSEFARAYELEGLKPENWALGPLAISSMYESVILPPWQNSDNLVMLEKGWNKRIEHSGLAVKLFSPEGEKDRIPDFEKWYRDERLDLLWSKQLDFFRYGSQRAAALEMLDHVKLNLENPKASGWISEFSTLVVGDDESPAGEKAEVAE